MKAVEALQTRFGGTTTEFRGETTVRIDRAKILEVCRMLKTEFGFDMLTDVSGVDNYGDDVRYEVVHHVYSMSDQSHLRLKASVPEDDLIVDSVVSVWKTADWHEREAFDMFGIRFRGHPNLKRILMWDGYPYFPLRKDFPLAGIPTELPGTAVDADTVRAAPMLGGPFVPTIGTPSSISREPRQVDSVSENIERLKNPTKKEQV